MTGPSRRREAARSFPIPWALGLLWACACSVEPGSAPEPESRSAPRESRSSPPESRSAPRAATHLPRIERRGELSILHVRGSFAERGFDHGKLLGREVAAVVRAEFEARFARAPRLLELARASLPRLIEFPGDVEAEIEGLHRGLLASGADLSMPELGREIDLLDLKVANALDVLGLMACSGFTLHGEQVEGGGVLSGRNFDWPFTGPHMIDHALVLVEHGEDGATASVTWPGYVGAVTGVNDEGVAVFLHVGTGKITRSPEPDSWPTAAAAAEILRTVRAPYGDDPDRCLSLLGYTSPPIGFITRVAFPEALPDGSFVAVFEADRNRVVRAPAQAIPVTTNHFIAHGGRRASRDSTDREKAIRSGIGRCLSVGDHRVSLAEAWDLLRSVDRGGKHAFGTLHALVFRPDPWYFELRLAEWRDGALIPATRSERRYRLARADLFGEDPERRENATGAGSGR
ncbi:MAG: hypothetical protein Fur0037_10270 [Planctomycetota bacterium]